MRVVLFMAISANGIIARKNGEEDFISEKNWPIFSALAKECGGFVIGHKTYEDVLKWEDYNFGSLEEVTKVIVSRNPDLSIAGFEIAGSPKEAVEKMSGKEKILLSGGSTLNSSFAKENLIDELVLIVEPIIVGEGIPLFMPDKFDLNLRHIATEKLDDGRIKLRYDVIKDWKK